MRTTIVAGGAGFIGSHLCDYLVKQGRNVLCIDNLSSGELSSISHLLEHPRFTFTQHNIIEPMDAITADLTIDEIFNLACPASPLHYQSDPIGTTRTCVEGSINLLELAKQHEARILFTSTSEVYGDPLQNPQHETDRGNVNPHGIRACYDEGKRCAESLFFDYHRVYGVSIAIARLFNTYGPGMLAGDGRLIPNLITQTLQNKPMTIYGDGNQTRSFCYIDDTLQGLIKLMASTHAGPVNIGNPVEHTILEIAEMIPELIGAPGATEFLPLPADDPRQRLPDISRAKEWLDWQPKTNIKEGLEATISYFSEQLYISDVSGEVA